MLGVLITLAVVAVVAYCVLKNYYPPIILLIAGFVMLICAAVMGTPPMAPEKSTHFFGFDLGEAFTALMRSRLPGLGLNIMLIAGFSVYMDRIGASRALVKLCVRPLQAIRSPYVLLAVTYIVGQFMALFINSAVGLGLFRKSYSKLLDVFSDFFPHFTRVRAAFSKVGCIQLKPLEGQ